MDIWELCAAKDAMVTIAGELVRIVESQEHIATNSLVDSLEEQALLEALLDASKPPGHPASQGLSYLLTTPFRYPPLPHGSRFGARHEPSLFYGSLTRASALAEKAYYRLVFWSGMMVPPATGRLVTLQTAFGVRYVTRRGLRLQLPPFDRYTSVLKHPADYGATQQLGAKMRAAGIDAFEYASARDSAGGINVALYSPRVFASKAPEWQQSWLCDTRGDRVAFYNNEAGSIGFERAQFLVDGALPMPAM